jgi:hypothetical protein
MSTPPGEDKAGYSGHRVCINRRYCLKCVDSGVASCGESPAMTKTTGHWVENLGQWIQPAARAATGRYTGAKSFA